MTDVSAGRPRCIVATVALPSRPTNTQKCVNAPGHREGSSTLYAVRLLSAKMRTQRRAISNARRLKPSRARRHTRRRFTASRAQLHWSITAPHASGCSWLITGVRLWFARQRSHSNAIERAYCAAVTVTPAVVVADEKEGALFARAFTNDCGGHLLRGARGAVIFGSGVGGAATGAGGSSGSSTGAGAQSGSTPRHTGPRVSRRAGPIT